MLFAGSHPRGIPLKKLRLRCLRKRPLLRRRQAGLAICPYELVCFHTLSEVPCMVIVAPGTSVMQRTGNSKRRSPLHCQLMREEARMDQCFMHVETKITLWLGGLHPERERQGRGVGLAPILVLLAEARKLTLSVTLAAITRDNY